jgi:hypothetical protein
MEIDETWLMSIVMFLLGLALGSVNEWDKNK